jgi:quinoprotein glucose dehydrogenase
MLGLIPTPGPQFSDMEYVQGTAGKDPRPSTPMGAPPRPVPPGAAVGGGDEGGPTLTVRGLPLLKPPYGRITAFDMDKGEIAWQVAHGETPDNVRTNEVLKGLSIPRTGQSGLVGVLTTKTLVIAGEPMFTTTASGARGAMLRAYDKTTGKEMGAVFMPAPQSGSPMTYMLDGRQYIVVAVSGQGYSGELVAFRLPSVTYSRRE